MSGPLARPPATPSSVACGGGCGRPVPDAARYCPWCGTEQGRPDLAGTIAVTRRAGSVLRADIVGSMVLGAEVGAESWSQLTSGLFARFAAIFERWGGRVSHFTGDGVVALFGVPTALEGHAEKACRAALEIREAVDLAGRELRGRYGLALEMRIGVESGLLVAGVLPSATGLEPVVLGEVAEAAESLEREALPGEIRLGPRCAGLVGHRLRLTELASAAGASGAEPAFRLEGRLSRAERRARALPRPRFVGREPEMAALQSSVPGARGSGTAVALIGPAGVGKSRICDQFALWCAQRNMSVLMARGRPHEARMPLRWAARVIASYLGIDDAEPAEMLAGLGHMLASDDPATTHAIAQLLGDGRPQRTLADTARVLQPLVGHVLGLVLQRAQPLPRVVIVDDVQWLDRESFRALELSLQTIRRIPLLLVLTSREPRAVPASSGVVRLAVAPLGRTQITAVATDLLGAEGRDVGAMAERLSERSGGLPLYPVEVVRELVARGWLRGQPGAYRAHRGWRRIEIPEDVRAALCARVDVLPISLRLVLEVGAILGVTFEERALLGALDLPEAEGRARVAELGRRGLFEWLPAAGEKTSREISFGHPLLQEIVAGLLLEERACEIHRRVARALEREAGAEGALASRVASHWARGRDFERAIEWAAKAALALASHNLRTARRWWRLCARFAAVRGEAGRVALARAAVRRLAIGAQSGMSTPAARSVARQGVKAALASGEALLAAEILASESLVLALSGEGAAALRASQRALVLGQQDPDRAGRLRLEVTHLHVLFLQGAFVEMLSRADAILAELPLLADPESLAELPEDAGFVVLLRVHGRLAVGRLDEARRDLEGLLAIKPHLPAGQVRCLALATTTTLVLLSGDGVERARVACEEAVAIAGTSPAPLLRVLALWARGLAAMLSGDLPASSDLDEALRIIEAECPATRIRAGVMGRIALRDLDAGRALAAAETARLAWARASAVDDSWLIQGALVLARVCRQAQAAGADGEAERALERALLVARDGGYAAWTPQLLEEMSLRAGFHGDTVRADRLRVEALAAFVAIGAHGHVARLLADAPRSESAA